MFFYNIHKFYIEKIILDINKYKYKYELKLEKINCLIY